MRIEGIKGRPRRTARGAMMGILVLILALVIASCGPAADSETQAPDGLPSAAASSADREKATSDPLEIGDIYLPSDSGPVGDTLTIEGQAFPANRQLTLLWHTFDGQWETIAETEIVGQKYDPVIEELATVRTDTDGNWSYEGTVPEDFGGDHTIQVQDEDGAILNETTFTIEQSFDLNRREAPLGSQFVITARGLGYSKYRSTWEVAWDNGFTGMITAVTDRGSAEAVITASGPPGQHLIQVWRNFRGFPYLNPHQGPYGELPDARWLVTVTEPEEQLPAAWSDEVVEEAPLRLPELEQNTDAALTLSDSSGFVGDTVTLEGSGLPAGAPVDLYWLSKSGNRVTEAGYSDARSSLGSVRTDEDGQFTTDIEVPDDLGGTHPILAEVDGEIQAVAGYVIQPSIVEMTPIEGPTGTEITIHLKGVGWTEYDNTYTIVYDNRYLGYACGFNTNGDVEILLTAVGEPGIHTIDLYPTIYDGKRKEPTVYSRPQLTYQSDHPGRPLPALHFNFRITE